EYKDTDATEKNGIWVLDPSMPAGLYDSPIAERYKAEKYYGCYQSDSQFNVGRAVEFVSRVILTNEGNLDQLSVDLDLINKKRIPPARKKALILARRGQGQFRTNVIKIWKRCPLSKHTTPALLRASHIVSWAEARNDEERLNPYNGILLS